jgi:hypothetical protein
VSLGQQDLEKFSIYGSGLASVMNEVGTKDAPAVEKLVSILILAKGGELPMIDEDEDSAYAKVFKNQYVELFKQIYGMEWRNMLILHKMLTLSSKDIQIALNMEQLDNSKSSAAKTEALQRLTGE